MVTVSGFTKKEGKDQKSFCQLILQGDLELVKSKTSGRFYATAKVAHIASTFSEEICASLVGQKIEGFIKKVECPEYEYKLPESGELVKLKHRWDYVPVDTDNEEAVFQIPKQNTFIKGK